MSPKDQQTLAQSHPTETMRQSETPGQVNGVPKDPAGFLTNAASTDWLASNVIGAAVVNAANETVGQVDDLVSDDGGKLIGVTIGVGGFLGIGEKEVAIRFADIRLSRDDDGTVRVLANVTKDSLTAAPAYRRPGRVSQSAGGSDH
jgi:hypothetical protein